ncbi:MAG: hypothetical protein BGO49_27175 [Planctomycetales bacterium 71-10]|nr:MAG: hypothetical protein BGO49_27175 [Planctomycetales bacterium 71-10]
MSRPPLRLEYVDPATLTGHPKNWKFHPPEQLQALGEFIGDVGWADTLKLNQRTGRLLDGHGRLQLYRDRGEPVPVVIGDWSEAEEIKILRFLDPLGWMAKTDGAALDALTKAAEAFESADLSESLKRLDEAVKASAELTTPADAGDGQADGQGGGGPGGAGGSKPKRPPAGDVPDALWPSDNVYDVPCLLPELQADAIDYPVTLWGTQAQHRQMKGTWHFYTADEAFLHLWSNPAKVLPSGAPTLVEPNFSTHDQTPFAVDLWNIYRRRWLARYWQSQGKRVFVDINVHHRLLAHHEATPGQIPALLGVPKGWRAYATRAHGNRPALLMSEYAVAREHAGCTPLFLVYGGGDSVKELAREQGWKWIPEVSDVVRGRRQAPTGAEAE